MPCSAALDLGLHYLLRFLNPPYFSTIFATFVTSCLLPWMTKTVYDVINVLKEKYFPPK